MAIDAVILDLGNVLVFHDNEKLFAEMARLYRVTPDVARQEMDGLWDRANRGHLPGDQLRLALQDRFGREVDPLAWFDTWNCHFTIHAEMVSVVQTLLGRVKLVLLSNTHDGHMAYLRPRLPVLEHFAGLVLSYEVGHVKPERAIYDRALALAGTHPTRTVFFDDVTAYAQGATQVGMHGRVFTSAEHFVDDLAHLGCVVAESP